MTINEIETILLTQIDELTKDLDSVTSDISKKSLENTIKSKNIHLTVIQQRIKEEGERT